MSETSNDGADASDREAIDDTRRRNHWGHGMGIEILDISSTKATARIDISERHHQPFGIAHGGVYCSIVEDLASQAAGLAARELGGKGVVGVSNSTDFLRSHGEGELIAVAEPIHVGRRTMLSITPWYVAPASGKSGMMRSKPSSVPVTISADSPVRC